MAEISLLKLSSGDSHWTSLISQISLGGGLVLSGNKPLPESMLPVSPVHSWPQPLPHSWVYPATTLESLTKLILYFARILESPAKIILLSVGTLMSPTRTLVVHSQNPSFVSPGRTLFPVNNQNPFFVSSARPLVRQNLRMSLARILVSPVRNLIVFN